MQCNGNSFFQCKKNQTKKRYEYKFRLRIGYKMMKKKFNLVRIKNFLFKIQIQIEIVKKRIVHQRLIEPWNRNSDILTVTVQFFCGWIALKFASTTENLHLKYCSQHFNSTILIPLLQITGLVYLQHFGMLLHFILPIFFF